MGRPWRRICKHSAVGVLALSGAALVLIIASSACSYQGYCFQLSFFGDAPRRACSRAEYMAHDLPFTLEVLAFELWWVPISVFALSVAVLASTSSVRQSR